MRTPSGIALNIKPVKPADIPPEDKIIQAGRELIEQSQSWKFSKVYAKGLVKGYVHPKDEDDGEPWFVRVSEHPKEEASFDELWFGLGVNKAEHEKKFIHTIDKVTLIKRISDTQSIWNMHYRFPPPVSDRTFTVLQTTYLDTSQPKRVGFIVSIPIDVHSDPADADLAKIEPKGVRGLYCAAERILELGDGKTEWRMAASNTPGGSIPNFIIQASTPGQIANDVPFFLKWLKSNREYFKKGIETKKEPEEPKEPRAEHPGDLGEAVPQESGPGNMPNNSPLV